MLQPAAQQVESQTEGNGMNQVGKVAKYSVAEFRFRQ
jgi:hypothetical protein